MRKGCMKKEKKKTDVQCTQQEHASQGDFGP